jgi:L-iditol 2-dehydrogenase
LPPATISTVSRYQNTWPLGIALISTGRVSLDGIHTHSFPLSKSADALTAGSAEPNAMKAMIYPHDER